MNLEVSSHIQEKNLLKKSSFTKTRPVGAALFHADGQTDRNAEANSCFSQFCERALKVAQDHIFSESTFFLVTVARPLNWNFPFQKNISFRRGGNLLQDLLPNVKYFRILTYAAVASLQPHKFASPPSCHYYCILSSNRGNFKPNSAKIG